MFLYSSISTLMMFPGTGLALAYVPIRSVVRGNKINYSACNWYKSSVAMNHFIGGKSGGFDLLQADSMSDWIHYDWNTHVRYGDGVDEEHVDAYCCPFN
ncbi:fragment of pilV protein, Shufflon protein (C-ter part) [Escherichia coli]|nr:fragment of pilV protein, Shufflon protein (C-ter part) [Escherichia coli]